MDLQADKIELIKLVLETDNKGILKEAKNLFKDKKDSFELPLSQKKELDKRLERFNKGETSFYTWEQVEQKLSEVL